MVKDRDSVCEAFNIIQCGLDEPFAVGVSFTPLNLETMLSALFCLSVSVQKTTKT